MKKVKLILCMLAMVGFLPMKAEALFYDYTPLMLTSLQFCGQCTPSAISDVTTSIEMAKKMSDEYKKLSSVKDILRKLESYGLSLGRSLFNSEALRGTAREKVISYSRTIKKCKIADMDDATSVQAAFKKLFLQYPSDDPTIMAAYHDKLEQFKEDTVVEMYITATEMDKELQVMFAQLDNIEKCLVLGEKCEEEELQEYNCQSGDTEDKVCLWRNALTAVRIYDRLMRYNEYLTAMLAQMNATDNVGFYAIPKEYQKDKHSNNMLLPQKTQIVSVSGESIMENAFELEEIETAGVVSSLAGKEEDLKNQTILAESLAAIDEARRMHNLKQQLPNMKDSFVTYNKVKAEHEKTLKHVIQSHYCALSYMDGSYKNEEAVWLGNCSLGEQYFECKYNPEKSLDDDTPSFGLFDGKCGTEKCYYMELGDYYKVGGTGGWLANMYKEINADLNPTSARYSKAAEESGQKNILHMSAQDGDFPAGGKSSLAMNDNIENSSSGEDEGENNELKLQINEEGILEDVLDREARAADLLTWSLGASLNQQIAADTVSATPKLGEAKDKFPLWVDQMNFYNQYIDEKYNNIGEYIKTEPLYEILVNIGLVVNKTYEYTDDVNSNGIVVKSKEAKRQEVKNKLQELLNGLMEDSSEKAVAKVAALIAQEEAKLKSITDNYLSERRSLEEHRKSLFAKLESVSIKLDKARDDLSKANDDITTADEAMPIDTAGEEYVKKQKPKDKKTEKERFVRHDLPVEEYPQYKEYNEDNKNQAESKKQAEALKAGLTGQIKSYESERENIRAAIDADEEKIDELRGKYVVKYYEQIQKNNVDIDDISADRLSAAEKAVAAAISEYPVLAIAQENMEKIRENALKELEVLIEKLNAMKESKEIYYAENNPTVVGLHDEFIAKIAGNGNSGSQDEISGLLASMFSDVAENSGADDKYFVGIIPQKKDFAAPKAPVKFSSAPVREIFHFDIEDYDSIDKHFDSGEDIPETNENVLLVGQIFIDSYQSSVDDYVTVTNKYEHKDDVEIEPTMDFPEIWYYVLKNRSFEEKQIDLHKFLNSGNNEGVTFLRSGIYPCEAGGANMDVVSTDSYPWAAYSSGGKEAINECMYIDGKKDLEANQNIHIKSSTSAELKGASELGQILDYIEKAEVVPGPIPVIKKTGRLTFRQELQHAVYIINEYGGMDENSDYTPYYLYRRAMLDTNVFGDFLNNVASENKAREGMENVKNQIYGNPEAKVLVNEICNAVNKSGYALKINEDYSTEVVTDDEDDDIVIKPCQIENNVLPDGTTEVINHRDEFDLTDDDLYQQTEKAFEDKKTKNMNKAKEKLGKIKNVVTDSLKNKIERAKAELKLLEIDEDEIVNISGEETEEELKEKIKNYKADNAVKDKYINKRNETLDESIKGLRPPYCQSYKLYY